MRQNEQGGGDVIFAAKKDHEGRLQGQERLRVGQSGRNATPEASQDFLRIKWLGLLETNRPKWALLSFCHPENHLDNPAVLHYDLRMTQVALQIPDDLKPFIDRSVKSGLFCDASDFLVNLLYHEKARSENVSERDVSERLTRLRAEVNIGIDQLRKGECAEFDVDDIIQRGKARLAAKARIHG